MKICIHQHLLFAFFLFTLTSFPTIPSWAGEIKVGTWKTAQTIQPFYYQKFMASGQKVSIFSFTNPADQKMALLAGSLDMCGTTLAHAIHSASRGRPVVLVAALCNKCSALVVRKTVVPVKGGAPDVPRLTMTFGVINRARNVVFLVSGKEKAPVVKSILEDHDIRLPAARVAPSGGTLTWIMDREAASLLSKEMIGGSERQ